MTMAIGVCFYSELIRNHKKHKLTGFDCMGGRNAATYNITNDLFYLKYIIARIASYRHVWWSMANEFGGIACKNQGLPQNFPIWDQYFKYLIEQDPYR